MGSVLQFGIQVPAVEIGSLKLDFLNPVTKYYVILAFVALALVGVVAARSTPRRCSGAAPDLRASVGAAGGDPAVR